MCRLCPFVLSVLLTALLLGCDTPATQPERQVVVEGYLQGGAPMDTVRLTRSVGRDGAYRPLEAAVQGATVAIRRLADDGTIAASTPLEETRPGIYVPAPNPPPTIRPLTPYELTVTTEDGATVTATTTVPDTISIVDARDTIAVYRGPAQPAFTITPPKSGRQQQAVLVLTTTSRLDFRRPESQLRDGLTPFYADDYDPEDDSIGTYRTTSSGVLNEANFSRDDRGRITTDLPWISVAFYGPNEAAVHVIDDNFYDLIRSQQAQSPGGPGGGLGPGEIPNVIEHVEGGTGVFASYVRASQPVFIQCPPTENECPSFVVR